MGNIDLLSVGYRTMGIQTLLISIKQWMGANPTPCFHSRVAIRKGHSFYIWPFGIFILWISPDNTKIHNNILDLYLISNILELKRVNHQINN